MSPPSVKQVFVDESGYTGSDLCSPDQPVIVLASHDWDETEALALKSEFFGKVKAEELKYSALVRRPAQRAMIAEFLKRVRGSCERVKFVYAHKRYALVGKIVDLIMEPSMRRTGFVLYRRGGNIATTNLIYYMVQQVGGPKFCTDFLTLAQKFLQKPCPETFDALDEVLESQTGMFGRPVKTPEPLRETLKMVHLALWDLKPSDARNLSKEDLNLAFTLALRMMAGWAEKYGGNMLLIHDASSAMSKQRDDWEAIVSPHVAPAEVGWDRRVWRFPIGVKETRFESSKTWAGLQLADVLAGALADCLAAQSRDTMPEELKPIWAAMEGMDVAEHLWPSLKFSAEELGTTGEMDRDPIDHFAEILHQARHRRAQGSPDE